MLCGLQSSVSVQGLPSFWLPRTSAKGRCKERGVGGLGVRGSGGLGVWGFWGAWWFGGLEVWWFGGLGFSGFGGLGVWGFGGLGARGLGLSGDPRAQNRQTLRLPYTFSRVPTFGWTKPKSLLVAVPNSGPFLGSLLQGCRIL